MKKIVTLLLILITFSLSAQKQIAIDDVNGSTFTQKTVTGINWMADGKFYTSLSAGKVIKYDVTTGAIVDTIVDGALLNPKLTIQNYSFSSDEQKMLLQTEFENIYRRSFKAEYFVFDIATKTLTKLSSGGKQQYATFSPDASRVSFTRNNNLFYVDLSTMNEVQVTTDGKFNGVINGSTDWVYEEELSLTQAFYWSPDGKKIAYYRFDESNVTEYNLQKWNKGQLYPEDYRYKYPKAGEANSDIEIWIYDLGSKQKVKADLGKEKDIYLPRVMWTKDPNILSVRRLNRRQNEMDILHIDATGKSTTVLTEKSNTYVDVRYTDDLTYLKDGKHFIHSSERNGFKHLYLYTLDGTLLQQITNGNWEVVQFLGVDEKNKTVFYISTEPAYLDRQFYSIGLDGKNKTKLSSESGTHSVNLSKDFQYYLDFHSSASQPLAISLYRVKGNSRIKVLENNESLKKVVDGYGVTPKEFFTYKSADGVTLLDGYFVKPKNFDATKKYPVLVFQYSGPRSPSVQNNFGTGANFIWHQLLAQKGVLVAVLDTRGTGYRGEQFTKQTYKQLGKLELEDLLAGGKYLGGLSYVDKDRLGIWGWSFGGYMVSLAMMKDPGVYKLGIAGAPVTTWRYYDNIYTERFLQRPQENPSGYDDNSPLKYAANLKGEFLLIHGTGDDNVHFQNSVALEDALITAGKQFRSFYYPDQAHTFRGGDINKHRTVLMTDFILEKL